MTPKELAERLNGREYRDEVTLDLTLSAKENRIVIVFGASDDLMEFRGAIDDEITVYKNADVTIDKNGIVPNFEDLIYNNRYIGDIKDGLRDYFKREGGGKTIQAWWCSGPGCSWIYETDIPHETFNILEDGEPYCRGIVFSLDNLG